MKDEYRVILTIAASCVFAPTALAQFTIDWFTIDGGGGSSTGGAYSLSGTIGQPDAGTMTGGNYALAGGFWGVIQQDGLPRLSLELRAGNLVLFWPASTTGIVQVQSTMQLISAGSDWVNYPGSIARFGDRFELTIGPALTPPNPIRFFRLHSP